MVAGSTATFVALLSHVAGGGAMPGLLGIVVPWVLALAVSVTLAGRRLSAIRLALSVAISQFLFHVLFTVGASPVAAPTGHHAGAVEPAFLAVSAGATAPANSIMWIGHAVAAVITIAALYRGERAVRRVMAFALAVARRVSRAITARLGTPHSATRPVPAARAFRGSAPWDAARRLAPGRRGPPLITLH